MKKLTLLLSFLLSTALSLAEIKSGTCGESVTWTFDTEIGLLTISGDGVIPHYTLASTKDLTYITTAPWGKYASKLTSVIIEEGVTEIGTYPFYGCSSLTSVTIPTSVTNIGNYAFEGCYFAIYNFKNNSTCEGTFGAIICDEETSEGLLIKDNVAKFCRANATSVTIPNYVTGIENEAFSGCSGLTSVTIPNSVTSIGSRAFLGCTGLTSVNIPNSVKNIGDRAFMYCSSLSSVAIGNSVTSIGHFAFNGCSKLTSVTIPNSVTNIGNYIFCNCFGLTSVTIGNSVKNIGKAAFEGCSGLTSITIPNSLTSIEDYAFQYCSSLTSVIIPNSVTSIGSSAFRDCYFAVCNFKNNSTCEGTFGATICDEETGEGLLIKDNVAKFCRANATSVTIPNYVTGIENEALAGCSGLTSITIPNSVTTIGASAFNGCKLQTVISHQKNPENYSSAFSATSYMHATLYVPENTFWTYVYDSGWGAFNHIKEMAMNADAVKGEKAYMLADETGRNFSVYDSKEKMLVDKKYTHLLDEEDAGTCWIVREVNGGKALYNLGARMFATMDVSGKMSLSATPVKLDITDGENCIMVNGQSKMFIVNNEMDATEIHEIEATNQESSTSYYDLIGRKVRQLQKGIIIRNGKKMLVK